MSKTTPTCFVCTKPCNPWDKVNDGRYAHNACLDAHAVRVAGTSKRGGLLYYGDKP